MYVAARGWAAQDGQTGCAARLGYPSGVAASTPNAKQNKGPARGGCLSRLFRWAAVGAIVCGAAGAGGWWWLDATLPDVFTWQAYRAQAREASRVYAAGGQVVARFGDEIRTVIPAERIPAVVRYAMICAEDAAFYDHPGLDLIGIARALWVDVTSGALAQGASTITQQLAKTQFLSREKTVTRKLKELVLARKLETRLGKDEILTLYLNEVYFGHGRYGIEEAARFYFGRSAAELDVAQAALLAGLPNSPARLSPFKFPQRARARRHYVIAQLHARGYIDEDARARADAAPLPVVGRDAGGDEAAWYLEAVRREVLEKVDRARLASGGLRVEIALDVGLQRAAERAVQDGLRRLDRQYATGVPIARHADDGAIAKAIARIAELQPAAPPAGSVLVGVALGHDPARRAWRIGLGRSEGFLRDGDLARYQVWPAPAKDGAKAKADKTSEATPAPMELRRGDEIRVSVRENTADGAWLSPEMGPQAALVALEPATRLVRALVGGDDFDLHPFDRTRALRQPGSTFKTFAYGAAIEAGAIGADTVFKDEKRSYKVGGKTWTPRNFSGGWDGRSWTVRDALAHSINSIAVEVAARVGPEKVAAFAERLGVASPLVAGLPLALGSSSVTPIELTNAYATIAAEGRRADPILVTRIVDRDGKDVWVAPKGPGRQVVDPAVARQLADMLGEVVRSGSGRSAQGLGRAIAGKTGTSNGGRDAWFVGFSAELCTGVWVGYDDRTPLPKATGGTTAVPIFAQFVKEGLADVPAVPLPRLAHTLTAPLAGLPAADGESGAADLGDDELGPEAPPPPPMAPPPVAERRRPAKVDDDAVE